MVQASPSSPSATPANDATVEVEEAELSSEDEKGSASPSHSNVPDDDDFVLDDDDDDDDFSDKGSPHPASPNQAADPSLSAERSSPAPEKNSIQSSSDASKSPKRSPTRNRKHSASDEDLSDKDSISSQDDNESSSFNIDKMDIEKESNYDNDKSSDEESEHDDHQKDSDVNDMANGTGHDSDSEVIRRGNNRNRGRSQKLVIPDEMIDDNQYFRRSKRARTAPVRLAGSSPDSPSSAAGSDSDFKALDDDKSIDDDEEYDDEADLDFAITTKRRSTTRRRTRTSTTKTRNEDSEDDGPAASDHLSDSDSDGEWRGDDFKKVSSSRRKRRGPHANGTTRKRKRAPSSAQDDEHVRPTRINSRTGDAVNYFEGDDSVDSEAEPASKDMTEQQDDKTPRVEQVLDFQPIEEDKSSDDSNLPFSEFEQNTVQFRVKWLNKSYRKCTWETWDTLRNIKGSKKVYNYIKLVEERQKYFQSSSITPEEIEEAKILLEEHRSTLRGYEVVDRIISQRENEEDHSITEYLVKWDNLQYSSCTWELQSDLTSSDDLKAIDKFTEREQAVFSEAMKKRINPFNNRDERPKVKRMSSQPDYLHGEGRTLRDYQLAGLNYLALSWTKRNNVILADEMGLGKTLQTISFLGWLMYVRKIPGPFLVVVPLSTIAAWVREFARWLPDMNCICYTGDSASRGVIRTHEFWSAAKKGTEKFHVLLTTPELIMTDEIHLSEIKWAMIAVDEAHRLKNEESALHVTLASLRSANRLLVTGTPLQNSIRELWALLHFLNPDVFPNADAFEESFSFAALRDPERVTNLHKTLRPYIIRRQKSDVEKSLPQKTYSVIRVNMTSAQQQYYRWLLTRNFTKLNETGKGRGMGNSAGIRNLLMELKKCCNHPFLFPNYEDTSTPTTLRDLIRPSAKMMLLDKILVGLREKGHRVLIFSQMVRMLDILQDYCRMRNFPCQRLDGSVPNELRQRAVDHFNAPESTDYVFLLSTRAGGLGINLATADTVIIFDSDWNPQNDLQAESRAHRIGQKKDVKVYRFLTAESVEEDILERAKRKRVLEHVVIHGVEGGNKAEGKEAAAAFKKEELCAILRFGAEKLFGKDAQNNEDDKAKDSAGAKQEVQNGDAPTAKDDEESEKDEQAEERRVLGADDLDELLSRAKTEEASQIGAAQPSIGDSLLNAFKWADFKTVEEVEDMDDGIENDDETRQMAEKASQNVKKMDAEAEKARKLDNLERDRMAKEGDQEFWDRVIPGELRDEVVANDMILGPRRRKRTKTFAEESPKGGKRRRVTRTTRGFSSKIADIDELSAKEQRSLLRSLRKFGDPNLANTILADAGLQDRMEEDLAISILTGCLESARNAISETKPRGRNRQDDDPAFEPRSGRTQGKEPKSKTSRIQCQILGESVDAVELVKRCEDLKLLRDHMDALDVDLTFRLRKVIKPPTYNIRWKPQNDAMLLIGIYRHGFGNWTQIAKDQELQLADRMNVAGNSLAKPGSPDTTKLTRRVITLLREFQQETENRASKANSISKSKSKKANKKSDKTKRGDGRISKKQSRTRSKTGGSKLKQKSRDKEKSNGRTEAGRSDQRVRLDLKNSNKETLKELRSLSKESSDISINEKISRTKQCLLLLGRAIEDIASSSSRIKNDLWTYVHEVCRTNLDGGRLKGIYSKLSASEAAKQASS